MNRVVTTRSARRLGGGVRAPKYPGLEERLHVWVLDRNPKEEETAHLTRQRTTQTLPENAALICRELIPRIHQLIAVHSVKLHNIINIDQVPRYFETEPKTTTTTRGSREVLLRKSVTSRKQFTSTFAITASGQMLTLQYLFSMLKNIPMLLVE
ncbi:Hypothetical protein PHPALM_6173 [Phytophthora palmivora]|uniref:Uncharacterized protein n=1 Tax=Phytophthora palmivora TaxID=4796 RepID=A0A2P4YFK2_9STRA|nr:Hypothetical protein PHPALM_6173 [Phytophthora palmivora]